VDYAGDEGIWLLVSFSHHKDTKITEFHKEICNNRLSSICVHLSLMFRMTMSLKANR